MRNFRILLILILGGFISSCSKSKDEDYTKAGEIIEAQDHALSMFNTAYDILARIDSSKTLTVTSGSAKVKWIDTAFTDTSGISAIISFKYIDDLTGGRIYGKDMKLRSGKILVEFDKDFSSSNINGKVTIIDSIEFLSGYNVRKMNQISGSLILTKNPSGIWNINSQNFSYKNSETELSLNLDFDIKLNKINLFGIWGKTLTVTGSSNGTNFSNFKTEITENLELKMNNNCAGIFSTGIQKVTIDNSDWIVNYEGLNTEECDRIIKISKGRNEFFYKMY